MTAPTFGFSDRPVEILDGAGRWLARSMPEFKWVKSRQDIERKLGDQTHRVGLQSSTWSRSGIATWVSPRLTVLDGRLQSWRRANPSLTAVRDPAKASPFVFNSLFSNFLVACSSVEASGLPQPADGPRSIGLGEFKDCLATAVLPVLDAFAEPCLLTDALPSSWWDVVDVGAIEWAVAVGDFDSARLLLQRHLARPLRGQQTAESRLQQFVGGWQGHFQGAKPSNPTFSTTALGWISAAHALLEPAELEALLARL